MLNEKTKDEIYELHIKDPQFWTVRKLAHEYDTEMERIEAILVLKKMEQDKVAQVPPLFPSLHPSPLPSPLPSLAD